MKHPVTKVTSDRTRVGRRIHLWVMFVLAGFSLAVAPTSVHAQLPSCTAARFLDYRDLNCWLRGQAFRDLPCPPCPPGTARAVGMPRWSVSSPFQNVHVTDTPLSYRLSSGATLDFQWTHRQRYTLPDVYSFNHYYNGVSFSGRDQDSSYRDRRNFGATNAAWSHTWQSDILFWDTQWEAVEWQHLLHSQAKYQAGYEVFWYRPEGAVLYLHQTNGTDQANFDASLRLQLTPLSPLGRPTVGTPVAGPDGLFWGDGQTNGFQMRYADGSRDLFGLTQAQGLSGSETTARAFLTQHIDPQGRITRLGYELGWQTNAVTGQPMRAGYRVKFVVDYEGRTNTFRYANPYALWQLTEVEDPYGRKARAEYGSGYGPSKLIDAQGLTNSFAYATTSGWLSAYTTPYGTTSFEYYDQLEPGYTEYYQKRAVRVTEADGSKQLFLYHHKTDFSTPASVTAPTNVSGFAFDDGATGASHPELYHRNSFHWNARQYNALVALAGSSSSLSNQLSAFNTNAAAYQIARLQHWLLSSDTITATDYLSSEREASLDTAGTQPGDWTFYAYGNSSEPQMEPGDPFVTAMARVLPDGTTRFQSIDAVQTTTGQPTRRRESYTLANGAAGARTNWFRYSTDGLDLLVTSNSLGQFAKYSWNTNHQLLGLTNTLNETASVTYVDLLTEWKPQTVTLPSGQTVTYTYFLGNWTNISGTNVYVWRPDARFVKQAQWNPGPTWSFGYDKGLVQYATNDLGLWLEFTWDDLLRPTSTRFPDGSYTSNRYDKLDLVGTRDRLGNWTTAGYDALQRPTAITNANQAVTGLDWCGCGALNSITDALTNITSFYYDNQGRQTNIVFADNSRVKYFFNAVGQLTNIQDGLNRSLQLGYNNQGLLTTVSNAYGQLVRARYDAADRPVEITDENNLTLTNTFDLLNRLTTRVRSGDVSVAETYGWSTNGLIAYTNRNQQVTRYLRDAAGRLLAVTNANLEVTRVQLNSRGQVTNLFDGLNQQTQFAYDEYGLRRSRTDALGRTTAWHYNANGWLTNRITPQFGNTFYTYDNIGNLLTINHPLSTINYLYDALNQLTNLSDAVGVTRFTHTATGQLQSEDGPWTDDTLTYTYTDGLRTGLFINHPQSTVSFGYSYDAAWRLTNVTSSAGVFSYGFVGPSSLIQKLTLGNAAIITNSYGPLGQLTGTYLKDNLGLALNLHQYVYDPGNLRTQQVFATGNTLNYAYDRIGQLKTALGQESGGAARSFEQLGYTYDAAGNLNQRTNNAFIQTFNNNSLNELTTLTHSGTLTVAGNTTTEATNVTVNGLVADRYADRTYARTNFPLVNGTTNFTALAQSLVGVSSTNTASVDLRATTTFAYDLNGNLTNDGTRTFIYDAENQLVTNFVANAWKTEHTYDGFGRKRITRDYRWDAGIPAWFKTNETRYVYDGMLVIQERDANNSPQVTFTRGLDLSGSLQGAGGIGGLLARTDHAATTALLSTAYYHSDGSGNVTALVSTNGLIVARYAYDPFGGLTKLSGPLAAANRYRFSSKEFHLNSGLYYYGYRFYEPNLQRWLNQDPLGEVGGINLARFLRNSPLNVYDPFGLREDSDGLWSWLGDKIDSLFDMSGDGPYGLPSGGQLAHASIDNLMSSVTPTGDRPMAEHFGAYDPDSSIPLWSDIAQLTVGAAFLFPEEPQTFRLPRAGAKPCPEWAMNSNAVRDAAIQRLRNALRTAEEDLLWHQEKLKGADDYINRVLPAINREFGTDVPPNPYGVLQEKAAAERGIEAAKKRITDLEAELKQLEQ